MNEKPLIHHTDCIVGSSGKPYPNRRVNGKTHLAHRVAYCQKHGLEMSAIKGMVVRHRCDNPCCLNPEHLELGSHQDNMNDMVQRGRSLVGQKNGRAVLSESDVIFIRTHYKPYCKTYGSRALAARFGVYQTVISKIALGKLWKHIPKTEKDVA